MVQRIPRFSASRPFKIVFYAINGTGLGHLTRQLNIARALRKLLDQYGVPHQIEFLTTSDADHLASDFLVTKLPSKTSYKQRGLSVKQYNSRAKTLVSIYLAQLNPDWLVVDTAPQGAFNEISFIREHCRFLALIDRDKDPEVANSRVIVKHKKLYDLIVAPELESDDPRAVCVGKVHGFDPDRALTKEQVRTHFSLQPEERLIYLSAGGGGDETAGQSIQQILEYFSNQQNTRVLVGYGPLYKGDICYQPHVIPYQGGKINRYFAGVDFAISAAGYNSFEELMAARVPTVFYAQAKGMDRQDLRALNGANNGWNLFWQQQPLTELLQQLEQNSEKICAALASRPEQRGAEKAAIEIIRQTALRMPGEFRFIDQVNDQSLNDKEFA